MRNSILALVAALWSGMVMAGNIEEPSWQLVDKFDGVELRYYEPTVQARTTLASNSETSVGFGRLAGFIFGGNNKGQKIAMTAPVEETLGVDAPVMAFTMPAQYALSDLPTPRDPRVRLVEVPGKTVAVVRFSGWATAYKVERMKRKLLDGLRKNGIEPTGTPALNQYNPPWTLPFLRRNEVTVEVEGAALAAVTAR
ncbi:MAG: heme-binding protein [Halioglobus sp.]|nr:heme-binding protein [Halioglobus sp.]